MIQRQVLNYILKSGDSSIVLDPNVNEDFFSDFKSEYHFIKDHITNYNKVPDQLSFLEAFPEFIVIEVNEPKQYLLDALYKDRKDRFLRETFKAIGKEVQNNNTDKAYELYLASLDKAIDVKQIATTDILKDISRYDAYVERCADYNKYYIRTGFKELDDLFGGWDREEELATIVARTGKGKSWILLKMASAALEQGLRVGYYSGEMSARKVGYRFDSLVGHVSNYGISKGQVEVQNQYKVYIDNLQNKFTQGCLKILTPSEMGDLATVTALKAFIERENLDILFVDQHSLLEDEKNGKSDVERATNVSIALKKLQVLNHIPIIAASQQNRNTVEESEGITTAHIARADRIAQDSTIVLSLENKDDILTINITKCRDAWTGKKLKYAIDLDHGVFNYLPDSDNPADIEKVKALRDEYIDDGEEISWN